MRRREFTMAAVTIAIPELVGSYEREMSGRRRGRPNVIGQNQHHRNRLLAAMPPRDLALLEPHLQIVPIAEGECLHLPGDDIEQVYFLHRGIVSLMAISQDGNAISTASVGSEGAIGTIAGTGFVRAFTRALVQAPGVASQISVPHLRWAVRKSEAISDLLTRYHMALMCQVQQTSLCNSLHDAVSRLSRLLLVLSEQGEADTISFSQERLADMLGLRRSSVTVGAQTLQSRRFISYRRGRIEIIDLPRPPMPPAPPASRVRPQGVNRGRRGFASRAIEKPPTLCTRMQMSDTGLNAPGRREGSMAKLWTLAVLFVGYGAWIVLALPREEAVVNAIPFVFWALLFAWLALRARNKRGDSKTAT